jgi:DNA-binding transcriptional ArsR family regulator
MLNRKDPLTSVFRALAEPSRRNIVLRLSAGPATVSDLAAPLDMSLAAVMQHIQALEDSGLVKSSKLGRVRTCELDPDVLSLAEHWLSERRLQWHAHFDRLGDLLAEDDKPVPVKKRVVARKKKPTR